MKVVLNRAHAWMIGGALALMGPVAAAQGQPAEEGGVPATDDGGTPATDDGGTPATDDGGVEGSEAAPEPATPAAPALDERALVLCFSSDVGAREYCLLQIAEHGHEVPDKSEPVLRKMAESDVELHDQAAMLYRRLFPHRPVPQFRAAPPPPPSWQPPPAGPQPFDIEEESGHATAGDTTRVIFAPTAYVRPAGDVGLNFFQLGTVSVDYGLGDIAQIGARTSLPIGIIPLTVNAKVAYPFDVGAVGVTAEFGFVAPFIGGFDTVVLAGGGGPVLTLGNEDHYFNAGILELGAGVVTDDGGAIDIFVGHMGGSFRVADFVRLGIEGYAIGSLSEPELFGDLFAVMAGVRFFGDWIWGDVALLQPICGPCLSLYEVIPVGIPFLNFGMAL